MKLAPLQAEVLKSALLLEEEYRDEPVVKGWVPSTALLNNFAEGLLVRAKADAIMPGTFAHEYLNKKRAVSKCLESLCRRGLIMVRVTNLAERVWVRLTDEGRKVAERLLSGEDERLMKTWTFRKKVEKLKQEGRLEEELKGQLDKALKSLKNDLSSKGKPFFATPSEVLDALWSCNGQWYEGERSIFDQFWNARKLGRMMTTLGYRLTTRKEVEGKRTWAYDLRQSDDIFDMTAALAYLRKAMHLSHVDYWCVLAALWLTTGKQKYPGKEALMAYWSRKRVGRVIKSMGFETGRKTWRKETLRVYNIAPILKWQLPLQISEIIVEAPRRPDPYIDARYEFLVAEERAKRKVVEKRDIKEESAPEELEEKTADSQSSPFLTILTI